MPGWAATERIALADALTTVGADAPTLCEGWTAADLAAHVYVREHRPDATPGVLPLGPLSSYTGKVMRSALRVHGFAALVEAIRTAPPWLRIERVDDALNTVEMFVHTEDVRRANGLSDRTHDEAFEAAIWRRLSRQARLSFRRVPATVTLSPTGAGGVAGRQVGKGGPEVTVSGAPSELLLLAYNRKEHAHVTITGEGADALRTAKLGA
ncbi:MAG: TIGR03085 family protein [Frankiaceae bacterium]|nr:TIGR03085 family protein [Frankiaceae bacterium]MBV9369674.1 TIGR03085 family protein [Frankiales bacterium]